MSLQVWLPLNGDLRNQGLDNNITITTTDTTWQDSGKIGKCLKMGVINRFTIPSMVGAKQLSFSYWVRVNTATATNWLDSITWYSTDGTSTATSRQEFYTNSTYTSVWYKGGSMDAYYHNVVGEWNHYAFTIDYTTGEANYYINGKKHGVTHTNVDTTHYLRGDFSFGQSGLDLSENDIRIYDHILSPREVKEISKGLVLHYPLSMPGGENIIKNSQLCSNGDTWILGGTPLTSEFTTKEGFDCIHITGQLQKYFTLTPYYTVNTTRYLGIQANGNIYTLSFDVLFDNVVKGTTNYYVTFYKSGETIDGTWRNPSIISNSGHFTSATSDNLDPAKLNGKGWQRVYITIQFGNYAWANSNYVFQLYLRDFLGDVYIKNAKVELGDHATPWIPNPADSLYASLGLNNGVVYDCSGYGNNGEKMTDTITYSSDTARYNTSTHFNGTNDGIIIENLQLSNIINSEVTYSFWIKPENENDGRSVYFGSYSGNSWSVEKTANHQLRLYWNGSPDEFFNDCIIADDVWQHICITKSGTNDVKIYKNGVQVAISTKAHSELNFPTTYRIGRDVRSNDGTPYRGLMSDFRIYATALSAPDILELYHTPETLANNGTLLTQGEFVES